MEIGFRKKKLWEENSTSHPARLKPIAQGLKLIRKKTLFPPLPPVQLLLLFKLLFARILIAPRTHVT